MAQDPFDFDFSAPQSVVAPGMPSPPTAVDSPPGGPAYFLTGPAPKKKRTGLKIALVIVGLVILLSVGFMALGVWLIANHQSTAQEEIPENVQVGECIAVSSSPSSSTSVSCDEPHRYEVFEETTWVLSDSYPSFVDRSAGTGLCDQAFSDFVGTSYWSSSYDMSEVFPTEASWENGNRRVLCAIHTADMSNTVGSAGGTGR